MTEARVDGRRQVTILDAVADKNLFAPWFKDCETWQAWFAFLAGLFALPMTARQQAIFAECAGRTDLPNTPAREGWLICGRRGGKSFILAMIAVYVACFRDHRQFLAPGERATVMIIAADRRQARIILRFVTALLQVPLLAQLIERETAELFDLTNGVVIEVHTASFRSTRGYAIVAALLDELAFWPTDDSSAEPDVEILAALRPGMAQFPDAMLLCASSPYARKGALWNAHRLHYGKIGPVLVWQAPSRRMNPTVPQSLIDAAMDDDPVGAAAEYMAEFRSDVEGFVRREAIEACVDDTVYERAPQSGQRYVCHVDPSGGSADSFSLAIAHNQDNVAYLDCIREARPPFSPEQVVAEFAATLKRYNVRSVTGDRYAGEFPRELFRKHRITYELSQKSKSDLYVNFLPLINSRMVSLLDHPRLIAQLSSLERRTARSGKDLIDHAPGGHDDVANSVAGALLAAAKPVVPRIAIGAIGVDGRISWRDPRTGRYEHEDRNPLKYGPWSECWPGKGYTAP